MRAMLLLLSMAALERVVFARTGGEPLQRAMQSIATESNIHYNRLVILLGTTTLSPPSGAAGAFAVLLRRFLLGDAVAHSELPGRAIDFMLTGERHFALVLGGALIAEDPSIRQARLVHAIGETM